MGAGFASSLPRSHASGAGVGDALSRSLRIVAPLDLAETGLVGRAIGFSAACGGLWVGGDPAGIPHAWVGPATDRFVALGIQLGPLQRLRFFT